VYDYDCPYPEVLEQLLCSNFSAKVVFHKNNKFLKIIFIKKIVLLIFFFNLIFLIGFFFLKIQFLVLKTRI